MIKIKNLIFVFFLLLSTQNYAQQTPHFTQYLYNMQVINPATVGARSDLNVSLVSRHQWINVVGAPTTQTLSIGGRSKRGIAIGASVIQDKIGLTKSLNTNVDISYTLITSQYNRLAFGLKGGMNFFNNDLTSGITPDREIYENINGSKPNIGFGAFYYSQKYFVGFSIPYLLNSSVFDLTDGTVSSETSNNKNYFIHGGTRFTLSESIKFKPSVLLKYNSKLPVSIDFNANFLFKTYLEAGVSYRYDDSVNAMFAFIINEKFRLGYSYDHKTTNIGSNLSTHEIVLHVDFDLNRSGRWLPHDSCYF